MSYIVDTTAIHCVACGTSFELHRCKLCGQLSCWRCQIQITEDKCEHKASPVLESTPWDMTREDVMTLEGRTSH